MTQQGFDLGNVPQGFDRIINRLRAQGELGTQELQKAVRRTGQLGLEAVVDQIHHVRPHSGMHRRVKETIVTDLIDTGAYLNSWHDEITGQLSGKIATNNEYALDLELGTKKGMKAFYVASLAAKSIRRIFLDEVRSALARVVGK